MKRQTFPWQTKPAYVFKGEKKEAEPVAMPERRIELFIRARLLVR